REATGVIPPGGVEDRHEAAFVTVVQPVGGASGRWTAGLASATAASGASGVSCAACWRRLPPSSASATFCLSVRSEARRRGTSPAGGAAGSSIVGVLSHWIAISGNNSSTPTPIRETAAVCRSQYFEPLLGEAHLVDAHTRLASEKPLRPALIEAV